VEIPQNELEDWLTSNKRNLGPKYYNNDDSKALTRASGLFVYDIAIDLRTLFCVSTNKLEPELFPEIEQKLRDEGWIEGQNIFGHCLICPSNKREEIIKALADALINWRITSNQARTFSLMETLAIAISEDANQIAYAIRGELRDDSDRPRATPKIDETTSAEIFVTPIASAYISGAIGGADALDKAKENLIKKMEDFDYENQLS
jgi:hypothetical protein